MQYLGRVVDRVGAGDVDARGRGRHLQPALHVLALQELKRRAQLAETCGQARWPHAWGCTKVRQVLLGRDACMPPTITNSLHTPCVLANAGPSGPVPTRTRITRPGLRLPPASSSPTCVLAAVALEVGQEVMDDGRGYDKSNALPGREALEGNAHHLHAAARRDGERERGRRATSTWLRPLQAAHIALLYSGTCTPIATSLPASPPPPPSRIGVPRKSAWHKHKHRPIPPQTRLQPSAPLPARPEMGCLDDPVD